MDAFHFNEGVSLTGRNGRLVMDLHSQLVPSLEKYFVVHLANKIMMPQINII